jgi:dihydrofolate synthase/folylpolyglutamate synthase
MDFQTALRCLDEFVSYEDVKKISYNDKNFDLVRVRDFLKKWNVDYSKLKFVHVGGSKGKGTVCALTAHYLFNAGYKVGMFTSPHILDITERIWLNGKNISMEKFAGYVGEIMKIISRENFYSLTYFEILMIVAFKLFADEGVDYVVLEVGFGGRLDATNIVVPAVSVLTMVEKEHADVFGGTVSKILDEKLGIVKPNVPFVVGRQCAHIKALIGKKVKSSIKVFYVGDEVSAFHAKDHAIGISPAKGGVFDKAKISNAFTASVVLKVLLGSVDVEKFKDVFNRLNLPGRISVKNVGNKTAVFDMAHTKRSIHNLIKFLKKRFAGKKFVFVFAALKGKDVSGMLEKICPVAGRLFLTEAHEKRKIPVLDLKKIVEKIGYKNVFCESEAIKAYKRALKDLKEDQVIVVCGSHFLVGKILKTISL